MERSKQRIGLAVRILSNQIGREFERQVSGNLPVGVTGLQGRVILYIRDRGDDVFQRDIELEFDIRRSTATGMLQLMERAGFITREPVPFDARLKRIVLTQKACGIHDQIISEIDQMEQQLMNGLTEDEIDTFLEIAQKLSKNIR